MLTWGYLHIKIWAVVVALSLPVALSAQSEIVRSALESIKKLELATTELVMAKETTNEIIAMTKTIRAFESALSVMRKSLRRISAVKTAMQKNLELKEKNFSLLIGSLYRIEKEPSINNIYHPDGPLTAARAGMLLADVIPQLANPIAQIKSDIKALKTLEKFQSESKSKLEIGLRELQSARSELSKTASSLGSLPKRFFEDPSKTAILLAASETMDTFVKGLSTFITETTIDLPSDVRSEKGQLTFPVNGQIIREFNQQDAAGIKRPGIVVATAPAALIITPAPATILYQGELLEYGMVSILEPYENILFIFAGLENTYGQIGEILPADSPVGLMGGTAATVAKFMKDTEEIGSTYKSQSLYIEVRENQKPQNPLLWFAIKKENF